MRFSYVFLLVFSIAGACMAAEEKPEPEWTYDDDRTGQEDWGSIPGYETCREGMQQSPITISYTKSENLPELAFKYDLATGILNITKKSFIMEVVKGSELLEGKNKYTLQSVEFHSPSEHKIKDTFYPAEIHLVHKDSKGNVLIIAVFANVGDDNSSVNDILKQNYINMKAGQFTIDLSKLISNAKSYYSYLGSLPYPPCTENVRWIILKEPITISHEQLSYLVKFIGRNNRVQQPVYIRDVLEK